MKNQSTFKAHSRFTKPLSLLLLLTLLTANLYAQTTCNAHFYRYTSFNTAKLNFVPSWNPSGSVYSWTFGDGGTAATRYASHTYSTSGTYNVCLNVTYSSGGTVVCTSSWCDSVRVNVPVPVCNSHFYHHQFGYTDSVDFDAAWNPAGFAYSWDFGDHSSSTERSPNHTYAQTGTYYACLTVTDTNALGIILCSSTTCDSVRVLPPPLPVCNSHFYHHQFGYTDSVDFDAAWNPAGFAYAWDFGDHTSSTERSPNHTYSQAGMYYACLTVTDTDALGTILCSSTTCDSVRVLAAPLPVCNSHFYHHQFGYTDSVDFDAAWNPAGFAYSWDFGDHTSSAVRSPNHTYAQSGTYFACLTVSDTDALGNVLCSSTTCDSVRVLPSPPPVCNAHFYSYQFNSTDSIRFYPAQNPSGSAYSWNFNDGSTSTLRSPVHTFAQLGTYYVCLTVTDTDALGTVLCTDSHCDSVHLGTRHYRDDDRRAQSITTSGNASMFIYPNPVNDKAVLHIENTSGNISFRLVDISGRLVLTKENLNNGDFELNKDDFHSGLYFYEINDNQGNLISGKLVFE